VMLVLVQVSLGALTVLSRRDPLINSLHVVCGALVLTTSLVLTLRTWRVKFAPYSVRLKPDAAAAARFSLARRADLGVRPAGRPEGLHYTPSKNAIKPDGGTGAPA